MQKVSVVVEVYVVGVQEQGSEWGHWLDYDARSEDKWEETEHENPCH